MLLSGHGGQIADRLHVRLEVQCAVSAFLQCSLAARSLSGADSTRRLTLTCSSRQAWKSEEVEEHQRMHLRCRYTTYDCNHPLYGMSSLGRHVCRGRESRLLCFMRNPEMTVPWLHAADLDTKLLHQRPKGQIFA